MNTESSDGIARGTFRTYAVGFTLAILLTIVPFILVMSHALPKTWLVIIALVFAGVQILVHLVYFLHLSTSSEQYWNMLAAVYTLIVLFIVVGASIWIMFHLNYNMSAVPPHIVP